MTKTAASNNSKNAGAASLNQEVVAVIVGAIAAMGYSENQIASIRPVISRGWRFEGRLRGRF